jgi:hypothetical protein
MIPAVRAHLYPPQSSIDTDVTPVRLETAMVDSNVLASCIFYLRALLYCHDVPG